MKQKMILTLALMSAVSAFAATTKALSIPGYFGSINNNTGLVLECSQVVGGYCANNPMPANGYIQMLPDPGSNIIRGHVMVFDKNVPGAYVDNLTFNYQEQKTGQWKMTITSLYQKINIKNVFDDTVLLTGENHDAKLARH